MNAGKLGLPVSFPSELIKKGYERGKSMLDYFAQNIIGIKDTVSRAISTTTEVVKKNPMKITFLVAGTFLGALLIYQAFKTETI